MKKDSIGNRMKQNYEDRYRMYLTRRMPVILRLDGKAFHTLTRGLEKPFSDNFTEAMLITAQKLMEECQGAILGYVQSDEISIFLKDYNKLDSEAWFNYNLQKLTSVSASIATFWFNSMWFKFETPGYFDARAFNVPKEEVINYFIWRQQDWERNSINMYCSASFSHKELNGKNNADRHEMLYSIGKNWATDLPPIYKNGTILKNDMDGIKVFHTTFKENYEYFNYLVNFVEEE